MRNPVHTPCSSEHCSTPLRSSPHCINHRPPNDTSDSAKQRYHKPMGKRGSRDQLRHEDEPCNYEKQLE